MENNWKYWIVRPDSYETFNDKIGSNFNDDQIANMKKYCKFGIIINYYSIFFYNDINDVDVDEKWIFQFEISLKQERKEKLKKLNNYE